MKNDFNGDGKADIVVTSPWGIGLLNLSQSTIGVQMMAANGTRFGGWLLNTADNNIEMKADFDGDGRTEILMSSPWGIGILKLINGNLTSIAMAQNGTRHGGWIINTADNQFLYAADFDHDGREEILVTSPWGIGFLKYANNDITSLMLAPNGTRFGGWLLNTNDNFFTLVGDFDGDGKTELLVTSPWGAGLLKFNGATLDSIVMAPNNTRFGDWVLNTATDRFEVVGDFDGDGKAEILVSNPNKAGILKLSGNALVSICIAKSGERLGDWTFDAGTNKMSTVGDFDGDGKTEILVSNDWGLGLLKLNGASLQSIFVAPNGTRFGGWLLNTKDNRFNYVSDFDGDRKAELIITSPWGIGVLELVGNSFAPITMSPNGTRFGGWLLNTADNDFEVGLGQSYGLIIYHSQWQGAVNNTTAFLKNRGYTMFVVPNAANGIVILKNLALYLKACDRFFVYIAGHGGSNRGLGDTSKNLALSHILQFEDGNIVGYDQFAPSFQLLGNKGVDLAVFDGSCDGGEAVLCATGERYVALSTTTVYAPGITNTPDPSEIMKLFGKPSRFGLWWSQHVSASLLTSKTPHRFFQKIYRNDNTEIANLSLFYKAAITFYLAIGGGWDLMVRHCYLYRYIYPTDYTNLPQSEKDLMTGTADDYIASMRADFNAHAPSIASLRTVLTNADWVNKAANVYVAAYPKPWQTIFGDMSWNITAEPKRHTSEGNALVPGSYTGTAGFIRMVNEILNIIALLEQSYGRQESLLKRIDQGIQQRNIYKGVFKVQPIVKRKITDYLVFNDYDQKTAIKRSVILNRVNLDRTPIFDALSTPAETEQNQQELTNLINLNLTTIKKLVTEHVFGVASLDSLVADLKSILVEDSVYLDKLFYLLIIVEEAISNVQAVNAEPGDLVNF